MSRDELMAAFRTPRAKKIIIAVVAVAAVVFSAAWNPPVGTVHKFTTASDYNPKKESGCVNSGEGCHGSESNYRDFNAYHPDSTCTTCHEYQGVGCIPCHSPNKNHECAACHDGTMKTASDVVKLGDPFPRGHYRETTHTATGTDMTAVMVAAEGGKASAKCGDCHARDLRDSHNGVPEVEGSTYGPDIGCGECHNDVRSFGMAEVLDDWKKRQCEDCHKLGGSSVMHDVKVAGEVESGGVQACGESGAGCHESNDLHALHPDKPASCDGAAADGELGCHDLELQSHEPSATTCGVDAECHLVYDDEAGHENMASHSPTTSIPARDASYHGTPCGGCHYMDPDGSSLITEHDLPTSQRTLVSGDGCRNCHNALASLAAIEQQWPDRDTGGVCDACHGLEDLDPVHAAGLSDTHNVSAGSEGCASTGAGCHPGTDLSEVGEPTLLANTHKSCLRCHDRTASGGNLAFDPDRRTCGEGRDCHGATGAYDSGTGVHDGAGGVANGTDAAHHVAGGAQGRALLEPWYTETGEAVKCGTCHSTVLGTEHSRPGNSIASGAGTLCGRCHNASLDAAAVIKDDWTARDTTSACAECHGSSVHAEIDPEHLASELDPSNRRVAGECAGSSCHGSADVRLLHPDQGCLMAGCHQATGAALSSAKMSCGGTDADRSCHPDYRSGNHGLVDPAHAGFELDPSGLRVVGACTAAGCHTSTNIRVLHPTQGCVMAGCHQADGTVLAPIMSCGGIDADVGCHVGYSAANHFASHAVDTSDTDAGCIACHLDNLVVEHANSLAAGQMDADVPGVCVLCHDPEDTGNSPYTSVIAVNSAVAGGDTRCVSCHASGSDVDGPTAIASPHSTISAEETLPPGAVWADPLSGWRAALAVQAGGGHNLKSASALGITGAYDFPTWQYASGEATYTWALIPNTGATRWLLPDRYPAGSAETTVQIAAMTVGCEDCHSMPDEMRGPHGAAVRVYIDPEYSQTAYANPPALESQFEATGTNRVVCMKCHTMRSAYPPSVPETITPGGHYVHAAHDEHAARYGPDDPTHYGEKCVDCHVRIPHAWVRPRLLVRTAETIGGIEPDVFPYVSSSHDGLAGIRLRSFESTTALRAASCATDGCIDTHNSAWHPRPEDIPDVDYWP